MTRLAGPALALWAVAMGLLFVALDRDAAVTPEAAWRLVRALGAVLAWGIAALGAGGAVVARWAPRLLEDGRGLLHASVVGLGLWGLGGLALASGGWLDTTGMAALAALLSSGWLLRPPLRLPRLAPDQGWILLAGGIVLVLALPAALAPATDTDELYYHLALPAEMLREHGLVGGLLRPDGNRPMALHLPYAMLLAIGGDSAPRLLHLALSLGLVLATAGLARAQFGPRAGSWAALLLAGSWSFAQEAGLASNNLPAALAVLAALDAARRGEARALALTAGTALAIKYTAGGAIAGVFLIAAMPWRARVLTGLAALALVSPWWLRNALEGQHPLFPFAGWPSLGLVDFAFQFPEKYGAGRDLASMLLLPYNAVMGAETDSFRFLGRLSPALLALLPAALLALRGAEARRLALAAACAGAFWALGPHWLRYLLPGLPLLVLALVAGADSLPRIARIGLGTCFLLGVPANLGPLLERAADRLPAATGRESRDEFLARNLETWPVYAWANTHLPNEARVALLFHWGAALIERPTLLASVEDHIPTRYFLLQHGEDSLRALTRAGATHAIVTRVRFAKRLYPFLDEATFNASFKAPEELLERLLLNEATLVYEHRRTAVYRLSP